MKFIDKVQFLLVGFTWPILSLFAIYTSYLILGSLIFVNIETGREEELRNHSVELIEKAKEMINIMRYNFSDNEIHHAFQKQHEELQKRPKPQNLAWDKIFGDKMFVAFNLVTTVGFGNVAFPSTVGQIFSIMYTLFGLPINVVMMRLLSFQFRGWLRKALMVSQALCPNYKWILFLVGFAFFVFWISAFIFIPAYFFALNEDWQYNRGVYYSFVSLTTIGLGQHMPEADLGHMEHVVYPLAVFLILLCIIFGLGFVSMAFNMLSYALGVVTLDKLDCKCKRRAEAKMRLKPLLELMTDLHWQLVKCSPHNFQEWAEIEDFKIFMAQKPQDVTPEMLKRMFDVATNLKEAAYEQLSEIHPTSIPMTPIIERARENLPHILRRLPTKVSYSTRDRAPSSVDSRQPFFERKDNRGEGSSSSIDGIDEKNASIRNSQSEDAIPSATANEDDEDSLKVKSETSTSNVDEDEDAESGLGKAKPEDESATGKTDDDDDGKAGK